MTHKRRLNKYSSYKELARHEVQGRDYRIRANRRAHSPVLIVAPHGGMIEVGTSEIAHSVAGAEYSLFSFEGLKAKGANRDLHLTSHQFDHPECLAMAARSEIVLAVHGCLGESLIHVGGLDTELTVRLARHLRADGFDVNAASEKYPGRHPLNICNRGSREMGAQLEVTYDLRTGDSRQAIALAVRRALADSAQR
ncbi:MAG TPA: poly-gamma-glutamate hydrolase family protein [Steroidobacteraceae bacterium]|nr:poly-gamma-glutamate hydrolase family protein [Steroidobacteraceae bacterium]